jgi:hypothetical protein
LHRSATRWSSGPACRRCIPGGRRWPPCCTPHEGNEGRWEGTRLVATQSPAFGAQAPP